MVIHVNIKNESVQHNSKLHLLPCLIKSNDHANVSKYFEPNVTCVGELLTASFRGYPLLGQEINVPPSYKGVILQEAQEKISDESERNIYGTSSFDKFTYWNWDKLPTKNDEIVAALNWLEIAKVLHSTDVSD